MRARMIAAAACSWTRWVSRISISTRTRRGQGVTELRSVSAPAMQPVQAAMSALVASSMSGSAITSEIANRPPGCRTRAASRRTVRLVAGEVDHAVGDHHVDARVRERHVLEVALDELDVLRRRPRRRCGGRARASRRSCRSRSPCRSARRAARRSARRRRRRSRGRGRSRLRAGRRRRSARRSPATRRWPPRAPRPRPRRRARRRTRPLASAGLQSAAASRRLAAAALASHRLRASLSRTGRAPHLSGGSRVRSIALCRRFGRGSVGQLSHADSSFSASGIT